MSKKGPSRVAVADSPPADREQPPPPPSRDPKVPLTFDEMWFNADDEIEDEEERNHAKELKAHIMIKAAEVRQYLYGVSARKWSQWIEIVKGVRRKAARSNTSRNQEESLMVAIILQALQHMIVDRPNDPFRYLARFIRDKGPLISAEIKHNKTVAAARQAVRDKAKFDVAEADRLAREAAEAAAKALRDKEAAKLAAAARAAAAAAAEAAKKAATLKLQEEAAMAAAVTTDAIEIPIPKAGKKKKEPAKPAGPKKPEWQK